MPLKSHHYEFQVAPLVTYLMSLAWPLAAILLLIRCAALCHFLPSPYPALDVDRTILTHQTIASKQPLGTEWLFIGDSSCLMDISASRLPSAEGKTYANAYNLGTFMQVGLSGYTALLSHYANANTNWPKKVILLLHPEMLRGTQPVGQYLTFMSDLYADEDPRELGASSGSIRELLGLHILENRLVSRMPLSLPKAYGRYYGFNLNLAKFLSEHEGSAVDPNFFVLREAHSNTEYRLAKQLEPGCLGLRASLPANTRVVVGITPIPESIAPPNYPQLRREMLLGLAQWLRADLILTNLPATLPDNLFASITHLNEQGASRYTQLMAKELNDK